MTCTSSPLKQAPASIACSLRPCAMQAWLEQNTTYSVVKVLRQHRNPEQLQQHILLRLKQNKALNTGLEYIVAF